MNWLFNGTDFVTRNNCGQWGSWLPIVYQITNLIISLSYFFIPICLVYFYKHKGKILPKKHIILCFACFIVFCGLTHVNDIIVFYWAPYRFFTLILLLTAIVSSGTAVLLPGVIRILLTYKTPNEYQDVINILANKIEELEELKLKLEKHNKQLKDSVHGMGDKMNELSWKRGLHEEMQLLSIELQKIRGTYLGYFMGVSFTAAWAFCCCYICSYIVS